MRPQIVEESSQPRSAALRIRPDLDVLADSLKHRSAQFEVPINLVESGGELQVQSGVVLGQHVLAVGFFAHLDVRDRVTAFLDICHLRRGVLRRTVQHGYGDDGRQAAGDSAVEEQVKAGLIS